MSNTRRRRSSSAVSAAGPLMTVEHVDALAVAGNLVGQAATSPVLGLLDGAAEAIDDGLDLRVEFGEGFLGRLRRCDVDQFVLSDRAHMPPYGHQAAFSLKAARSVHCGSGARLNVLITGPSPWTTHVSTASADRATASSIPAISSGANRANTWSARSRRVSPRPTPMRSRAYSIVPRCSATDRKPVVPALGSARPCTQAAQRQVHVVADDQDVARPRSGSTGTAPPPPRRSGS